MAKRVEVVGSVRVTRRFVGASCDFKPIGSLPNPLKSRVVTGRGEFAICHPYARGKMYVCEK
jgi:hypothetical protein